MPAIVISAPISSNHAAPVSAGGTGATTAAAARTNLDVYSKSEVTNAISQSTAKDNLDLSSKTVTTTDVFTLTSGVYRCNPSAPNLPVQGAGYMTVIYRANDTRCLEYITDSGRFFTNTLYNGTWTGWKEYEDKQSTADAILALDIAYSNVSVPATGSTYVSYTVPTRDGYSRAWVMLCRVSGSGTGNLVMTIHGDATSGTIYLSSGSGNAITANFTLRAFYVKGGMYRNVTGE